jgi:aryl-alcohol dehydrogenase-like predicted oxidoreductase
MDYINLGSTGLKISRLCLGCMTYGDAQRGRHSWVLPEGPSRELIRQALDAGINFFDTANSYSAGTSEEYVGRAIKDFARRDEIVLATKVYFPGRTVPTLGGCHARQYFKPSTTVCVVWVPTMSTCIRSIAGIIQRLSRKPWKRCMTSSRPVRSVI